MDPFPVVAAAAITQPLEPGERIRSVAFAALIPGFLGVLPAFFALQRAKDRPKDVQGADIRPEFRPVPDVVGYDEAKAVDAIRKADFRPVVERHYSDAQHQGHVFRQVPPAAEQVEGGSTVTLLLGAGPAPVSVSEDDKDSLAETNRLLKDIEGTLVELKTDVEKLSSARAPADAAAESGKTGG